MAYLNGNKILTIVKPKYLHQIAIYDAGVTIVSEFELVTDSPTQLTNETVHNVLAAQGYTSTSKLKVANGRYQSYLIAWVYADNQGGASLYKFLNNNQGTVANVPIESMTVEDRVTII